MNARLLQLLSHPIFRNAGMAAVGALGAQLAVAGPVDWTDWSSATSTTVSGSVLVGTTSVGVSYSGPALSFAQVNGAGTNYWAPNAPYLSPTVSNSPGTTDIVALASGGTSTITFSQAVTNPLIALVSWNGAVVHFGGGSDTQTYDIQYLSSGTGFWGTGSYGSPTSNSFNGVGELHGVIELLGTYQTITFTDTTNENWHGLTVGVEGGIAAAVPEPETYALMLAGLAGLALMARRRKS